jgi:prolyl-tRNA editing enzyme YbaK/EbsC (Cys-tRNA(Pro) deacylase)
MSESLGSVARVRAALLAASHPDTITEFPAGTRTAADAAAAVGCTVAQIAKSIVFRPVGDQAGRAAVIITSGANRVDPAKAAAALGVKLAPIGHITPPLLLLDEDLLALDPIWAAAGTPSNVFQTTPAELCRITGAAVAEVKAGEVGAAAKES